MSTSEVFMAEPISNRSEIYLRFSRRSMAVVLMVVLMLSAMGIALTLHANVPKTAIWLIPIAIAIAVVVLQSTTRGDRWDPESPEAKALLNDEWRQANLNRATRVAFGLTLLVQVPLGLLFAAGLELQVQQAVTAMVISTTGFGVTSMISLFLWFDRE